MLQSIWAVAAQYCEHEKNPKADHIGHHVHKHDTQKSDSENLIDLNLADNSNSDTDADCPYCHLGSIKSLIINTPVFDTQIDQVQLVDIYYSYPEIIPLKPERPNWNPAV